MYIWLIKYFLNYPIIYKEEVHLLEGHFLLILHYRSHVTHTCLLRHFLSTSCVHYTHGTWQDDIIQLPIMPCTTQQTSCLSHGINLQSRSISNHCQFRQKLNKVHFGYKIKLKQGDVCMFMNKAFPKQCPMCFQKCSALAEGKTKLLVYISNGLGFFMESLCVRWA